MRVALREEPADVQAHSSGGQTVQRKSNSGGPHGGRLTYLGRIQTGRQEQIWYFDELLTVHEPSGAERLVEGLARVVIELRQLSAEDM